MTQIIKNKPAVEVMTVNHAIIKYCDTVFNNRVISYETHNKKGIGILRQISQGEVGFIYFSHAVLPTHSFTDMRFKRKSLKLSLEAVLDAGRTLNMHKDFHEFIKYANYFYSGARK